MVAKTTENLANLGYYNDVLFPTVREKGRSIVCCQTDQNSAAHNLRHFFLSQVPGRPKFSKREGFGCYCLSADSAPINWTIMRQRWSGTPGTLIGPFPFQDHSTFQPFNYAFNSQGLKWSTTSTQKNPILGPNLAVVIDTT